jgi:LAGLIDADG endonuclease
VTVRVYGSQALISAGELAEFLPEQVGFYLAGLTDGEGCFHIAATGYPSFVIKMRADDRPLLERVQTECGGIGSISRVATDGHGARKPQVLWRVQRKRELVWLTEVFDAFPLWSKKARDYEIWRDAVVAWSCGASPRDLISCAHELRSVRLFPEADAA